MAQILEQLLDTNNDSSPTDTSDSPSQGSVDDGPVTVDVTVTGDGMETTSTATTKLIHKTSTRTRRVHLVTRHVTKRVHKFPNPAGVATLEETASPTNKTTSIVTPTFPLPIARCPRADQPCVGAGFACNGYEFGQCINNRWLMRPCSNDRATACFNAGPDLIACDFTKGRSLQVCDDILSPLPVWPTRIQCPVPACY
ncbi:hypothetical protein DL89DRAFT_168567 [Linderina pennispora]|uniref:Uncharacterized protein n=1 Tax=Linderina pennispora TaxID=61395 RepID=A0A1Y1W693_9FUNG|nr:uncharacterized protein DL89DRAFT_168567 [Linderina pennispora]ORX68932.1 hypothetical protein DL89DRAFT_168567 [Linderina pennispora]